jgi:biopolymer transport protein ExbD
MQKNKAIVLPEASNAAKAGKGEDTGTAIVNVQWLKTQAITKLDDTVMPGMGILANELAQRREAYQKAKPKGRYRVVVRADVAAQFSAVRDVMEACAAAGINNVTFSVIQKGAYTQGGVPATPAP